VDRAPKGNYLLLGGSPLDANSKVVRAGQMKVLQPFIDRGDIHALVQALEDKGWSGRALVSGQDADPAAIERIFDGSQLMTVYKPVGNEARAAAEAAMKLARHEDVESRAEVPNGTLTTKAILLPPICVTQENAKQTVLKDGFQKLEVVKQSLPKDKQVQLDRP
jgi:D-xylose transport system substrate-binding protein